MHPHALHPHCICCQQHYTPDGSPLMHARSRTSCTRRDGGGEQQRRPSDGAAVPPGPPLWWASLFVRAGRMGSTNRELRGRAEKAAAAAGKGQQAAVAAASTKPGAINVTGFKEQDQENLYEQVRGQGLVGGVWCLCLPASGPPLALVLMGVCTHQTPLLQRTNARGGGGAMAACNCASPGRTCVHGVLSLSWQPPMLHVPLAPMRVHPGSSEQAAAPPALLHHTTSQSRHMIHCKHDSL